MTKYGFQVKLDHKFPEKWDGNIVPALNQVWELVPLGLRYLVWYVGMWFKGKKPFIDQLKPVTGKQIYGVPLGGIGAGTIGRGFCGQFTRFQMRPSLYEHTTAAADQFIVTVHGTGGASASAGAGAGAGDGAGAGAGRAEYCQVLSACGPPSGGQLSGWRWSFPGAEAEYRGLYPRAWTDYHLPGQQLNLTCRQISPVLPHNYKDTSLPCAVFVWDVENTGDEEKVVSITFTFENGTGRKHSSVNCSVSSLDAEKTSSSGGVSGLVIDQEIGGAPCQYVVAARTTDERVQVSKSTFSPSGDGLDLWNQLSGDGSLTLNLEHQKTSEAGVAVSARVTVPGGGRRSVEMALAWHMPEIRFRSGGEPTTRYYSRWFPAGREGAEKLCQYALDNYRLWEEAIEAWQQPVLNDPELPDWYKSAIFNELYFISDGGSLWLEMPDASKLPANDPRREYGRFGYLESHEYIMYNTYDVHFYSSPALVHLWPQLQLSLQYDMADYITQEDPERRKMLYTGQMVMRKVANTVPHDVGNPGTPDELPFVKLNSYQIHDVSAWKDLNLKFVLQVFRDHRAVGSAAGGYLSAMWPSCRAVMTTARAWDTDGDGMIENSGAPDQTYDTWVMHGVSAYCGGLWIAALYAMSQMARELGDEPAAAEYGDLLARAQKVYVEKLWTVNSAGSYYKFDTSPGDNGGCIMADQLCGHWYLRSAGVTDEVFSRTEEALRTVYENNVLLFNGGRQGAVNGMLPDGRRNTYTLQSEETWTGVTYALAAAMVHEGMIKEGLHTAEGIYRTVYERIGQGYETPEALYPDKHYRAVGYMRPLSIWAIQRAWEQRRRNTAT